MATPSRKSQAVEAAMQQQFGFDRRDSIKQNVCIPSPFGCGKPATVFTDAASAREYTISGLCQECQDAFFGA